MKDFIGLQQYIDEEYAKRIDHRFHAKGCPMSPKLQGAEKEARELAQEMGGRQAREKGLKAYECTGEMLDQAAAYLDQRRPGLDTATVQKCLDPEEFIRTHNQLGGTAPEENARLLAERRKTLDKAIERHRQRVQQIQDALARLDAEAEAIVNG